MADTDAKRATVRLAAAVLAGLMVAFAVLTYLSYTAAFASIDNVTVSAPRAGLVMEQGAKVKYRVSRSARSKPSTIRVIRRG